MGTDFSNGGPAGAVASTGSAPGVAAAAGKVYAALDLGTNNCRLMIAVPAPPGFRVVDSYSRIVRLGEGLASTGELSEAAMRRALIALRVCQEKLILNRAQSMRLITTEACRTARNGEVFLQRVRDELGLRLDVVDRATEARLAVTGCELLLDPAARAAVIFDIGGGSTELAYVNHQPGARAKLVAWTSLSYGVVTLAERYGGQNVSPESFAAMVEEISRELDHFPNQAALARAAALPHFHLLGTSGTVTTIAGVHLGLKRYDRRRVDGLWMNADDMNAIVEEILSLDYTARVQHPCIGPDRADLVLAGCAIFEAIRNAFPARRLRVADRGLREGLLIELMRADGHALTDPDAPGVRPGDSRFRAPVTPA